MRRRPDKLILTFRVWLTAVRPFAYSASIMPVVLGAALTSHAGYALHWGILALTLVGVVCIHTAANLLNDCFDHRRGLDREVFSGSGAVVRGWITEHQAFQAAMIFLFIGILCVAVLVVVSGLVVLLLALLGTGLALGYTTARFCFKYHGMGDAAVFIAFGILPVFGTWWVQTRTFDWFPVLWAIPPALLTVGILHANNWRDLETDRIKNCRTMASLLGYEGSRLYYRLLMFSPFVLVALFVLSRSVLQLNVLAPPTMLIIFLAFPAAWKTSWLKASATPTLDEKTARLHLAFGLLVVIAFVLA